MTFALLSELHRLHPDQIAVIDHIILDDGDWDEGQIAAYIARWHTLEVIPHPEDWTRA